MNKIKFSHNWNNKLNNDIFTTIRKYDNEKYYYYFNQTNKEFEIVLNGNIVGKAVLINVEHLDYINIPYCLLRLDTGLKTKESINELFNKFGINNNSEVLVLTFERINKETK